MATVWFEGIDELNRVEADLGRSAVTVGAKAAAVVRKSAHDIEALSKQIVPVDTGFLRGSITTEFAGDGRFASFEAEIGPEADYGMFVETGTERMAPRAYMGPAFDRVAPDFVAAIAKLADPFGSAT